MVHDRLGDAAQQEPLKGTVPSLGDHDQVHVERVGIFEDGPGRIAHDPDGCRRLQKIDRDNSRPTLATAATIIT